MKKIGVIVVVFCSLGVFVSCDPNEANKENTKSAPHIEKISEDKNLDSLTNNLMYVPAYSQVYSMNSTKEEALVNLSVTLSIRNTDINNTIIIRSIKYYKNNGELVKDFIEYPMELAPMASENYFISASDKTGGIGANFIVEWSSEEKITNPFIEALMLGGLGNYGYSWSSIGYPLNY
jgi:hypothetical protein